jgi:hypothetical protein
MAREALDQYQSALRSGEEPSYPQWADDMLMVCDEAEASILLRNVTKLRHAENIAHIHRPA